MDPDQARAYFEQGGTVLLLDLPPGSEFGIDYSSWTTGPKFKGVKMIPPGLHFVYWSASSSASNSSSSSSSNQTATPTTVNPTTPLSQSQAATGVRTGIFIWIEKSQILPLRYNPRTEDLIDPTSLSDYEQDIERFRHNLKSLDPFLAPYPLPNLDASAANVYQKWTLISNYITKDLLNKLLGPLYPQFYINDGRNKDWLVYCSNKVSAMLSISHFSDVVDPRMASQSSSIVTETEEAGEEEEETPSSRTATANYRIAFTSINLKKSFPPPTTPSFSAALVTKYSMDKSYLLSQLITTSSSPMSLLGELQFAFIVFFLGHVYDGFEQWKTLLQLICFSEEALSTTQMNPILSTRVPVTFWLAFMDVFMGCLDVCPDDLFLDALSKKSFVEVSLMRFIGNVLQTEPIEVDVADESDTKMDVGIPRIQVDPRVKLKCERELVRFVEKRFGWDVMASIIISEMNVDVNGGGGVGDGKNEASENVAMDDEEDEDEEYKPVIVEL